MFLDYGIDLRRIEEKDLDELKYWRNIPEIYKWCRQNNLISSENQRSWFDKQTHDNSMRMFTVCQGGTILGVVGLTDIDLVNRRAEFSLYIGPEHQKQGYAKKALKTIFSYGFDTLGLNVIWGETFAGNPAAKMFEKIGMVKEGTRREFYFKDGRFIDAHLYSITKKEWDLVKHDRT